MIKNTCLPILVFFVLPIALRADDPLTLEASDLPTLSKDRDETKKNMAEFREKFDGKIVKTTGKLILESAPENTKDKHYHYSLFLPGTEKKSSTSRRVPQVKVTSLKPFETSKNATITGKLMVEGETFWIEPVSAP
jgi:hypothetical protein